MKTTGFAAGCRKRLLSLAVILPLLSVLLLSIPALAAPVVVLSPASGVASGTEITITGTVFDSYKGDSVHIFFDTTEIIGSPLTVPQTGTFTIPFTIPAATTPGRHWVRIKSEAVSTSFLAENFLIIEETGIILDIVEGTVGTKVTISGTGFYAERTVTLYYYNIAGDVVGSEIASPVGRFTHSFAIPGSTGGVHRVTASNAEGNLAETEFKVLPDVTLNLSAAGPKELLNITGTGFGYRSNVDIIFGTSTVATVKTDDYGSFDTVFNVPDVKPNPYDVKAQDEVGNVDQVKFTITAGVSLSQTTGSVGSQLTIKGSGFKIGETVTVDYDDLRVATAKTDNNGSFTATFNVPPGRAGSHVVTASDGTTTRQLAFTVESQAPQVPAMLLPSNSSETRAEAYLDWQDVTDPSLPVVYSLQLASDQNFSSTVLEKEGLPESEYALTAAEKLTADAKSAPYFWRVKAIDGAGNESEWSAPWSFYVNAPPTPALLLPASDSKPDTPIQFNWQDVTSLSPPVTYDLQLAADLDFTPVIFEKTGLTASEYLLEEKELELERKINYYWRVKAIDSAGNGSEWSAPGSFSIRPSFSFPGWAVYTLIGIGVIIVTFLAFRLGRRTAYRPPEQLS
jgi:hypothetical protein